MYLNRSDFGFVRLELLDKLYIKVQYWKAFKTILNYLKVIGIGFLVNFEVNSVTKFVNKNLLKNFNCILKRSHKLFTFSILQNIHTLGLQSLWDKFARKFALLLETMLISVQFSITLLELSIFHKILIKLLNLDLILGMTMWELKRNEKRI